MRKPTQKTSQFHVMKREYGAAGGYIHIAGYRSKAKAEKMAAEWDTKLKGQRLYYYVAWTSEEFEQWHEKEISPYCREG